MSAALPGLSASGAGVASGQKDPRAPDVDGWTLGNDGALRTAGLTSGPADLDPPNHASVSPALSTTPPTDGAPRASDAGTLDAGEAVPTGPHKMALKKWRHSAAALQASQRASPRLAAQDSRLLAPVPPAPLELSASPPVVEGNLSYAYGAASAPVVMEQPQEHAPSPVEKPTEVSSTQPQDAPTTVMSPGKRAAEGSPVGTAEHTPKKARKDSDEEPISSASTSEVPGFDSLFVRQEALLSQVPTPPTPSEDNTKPVEMPVAAPKGEPDQTNDEASSNPFLTPAPTPSCKKPRLKGAKKSTNGSVVKGMKPQTRPAATAAAAAATSTTVSKPVAATETPKRSGRLLWVPEIQFARCMSARYKDIKFSRCVSCTRRWAGDTCRFQNIRYFLRDKTENHYPAFAFIEYHHELPLHPDHTLPTTWNVDLTMDHIRTMKRTVAKALLPVLLKEEEHVAPKATIYRVRENDVRATCDTCMTSLFAGSWLCRLCGREACGDCYKRIKEATYLPKDATAAHKKALAQRREQLGNTCISLSCNKKREHTSNDFTPMTRFERVELETAIKNMKVIVEQDDAEMADAARQPVLTTFAPIAPPENAAYTPTISHPTPLFDIDQLDHDVFRSLWAKGNPLVVDGVLSKMNVSWTPEFFIEEFGKEECSIVDCQSDEVKSTTVKEFFATFGNFNSRNQHVWKLKDWPSTTEFKTMFPDLFNDFCNVVPIPDYVRPDGVNNVASFFPTNGISPDLGPKMYNAQATSDKKGSHGSTKLHMDMSDALNIMTSASDTVAGGPGYAIWDIFRAGDATAIRTFMRSKFSVRDTLDPIHTQQWYLDTDALAELFVKTGIKSHRIFQLPGQAVFVPAGCAHQVANMADCIKVAVDFVSPENITRCEQLTREFQEQNQSKIWKEDVLQLRTMMWFAWQTCCQQESTHTT